MRRAIVLAFVHARWASLPGWCSPAGCARPTRSAAQPPAPPALEPSREAPLPAAGALPDLTGIAQRAVDGVTNISSTQTVRRQTSPFASDPFFQFFFGDDPFSYRDRREQSLGSGVVVSRDGYVLTNNHVVSGGNERAVINEVTVMLPDKRELQAKLVGTDAMTDIAVLKIDATDLPALTWGDSSKLKVAEWVLAVGNPYQLNQTVTLGIVSATGRRLGGSLASYEDFIQTDAAINPGNSGGALINARGELIGINTAIYSQSGGYQGIGFAVPSNLARHVMDDIIKYGAVRRGTISRHPAAADDAANRRATRRDRPARRRRGQRRSACRCLRAGPAARRHHRQLQRHEDRRRVALHPAAVGLRHRHDGDAGRVEQRPGAHRAGADRPGVRGADPGVGQGLRPGVLESARSGSPHTRA